jgi:hypothetical protein
MNAFSSLTVIATEIRVLRGIEGDKCGLFKKPVFAHVFLLANLYRVYQNLTIFI